MEVSVFLSVIRGMVFSWICVTHQMCFCRASSDFLYNAMKNNLDTYIIAAWCRVYVVPPYC